jgi:hypothetical protein
MSAKKQIMMFFLLLIFLLPTTLYILIKTLKLIVCDIIYYVKDKKHGA